MSSFVSESVSSKDAKTKKPKSNKERARAHRARKKEYITVLEQKTAKLEAEVSQLKAENDQLKQENDNLKDTKKPKDNIIIPELDSNPFEHALQEYEDYFYKHVCAKIKKEPGEVRFTMLDNVIMRVSDWSDLRVDYIKRAFSKIIENVVSNLGKSLHISYKKLSVSNWLRKNKAKKRHFKYFDKKVESATDIYLEYKFSDNHSNFMEEKGNMLLKEYKKIQKIVHKLVQLRNKLLNTYKEIEKIASNTELHMSFEKEDITSKCEICERLNGISFLKPHRVWDIPFKTHNNERYEDAELSE
ncbi:unnamed protein product [Moneuplotes crassus]|uniref:BZIP domain-containing protein n=1 Tax=Euplotes crassus TaxID=5936 RepID=A0AAD2CZJ2_EUPCR|nr:unnamed protein product [Moneuplotes crassus]